MQNILRVLVLYFGICVIASSSEQEQSPSPTTTAEQQFPTAPGEGTLELIRLVSVDYEYITEYDGSVLRQAKRLKEGEKSVEPFSAEEVVFSLYDTEVGKIEGKKEKGTD